MCDGERAVKIEFIRGYYSLNSYMTL